MKKIHSVFIFFSMLLFSKVSFSQSYSGSVSNIVLDDARNCVVFSVSGVSNIDGSGVDWFAIPKSSPFYKEKVAALFAAKSLSSSVTISTAGTGYIPDKCGGVEFNSLMN